MHSSPQVSQLSSSLFSTECCSGLLGGGIHIASGSSSKLWARYAEGHGLPTAWRMSCGLGAASLVLAAVISQDGECWLDCLVGSSDLARTRRVGWSHVDDRGCRSGWRSLESGLRDCMPQSQNPAAPTDTVTKSAVS